MKIGMLSGLVAGMCAMVTSSAMGLTLVQNFPDVTASGLSFYYDLGTGSLSANGEPASLDLDGGSPEYLFDLGGTYTLSLNLVSSSGTLLISGDLLDSNTLTPSGSFSLTGTLVDFSLPVIGGNTFQFLFDVTADTSDLFGNQVGVILIVADLQFDPSAEEIRSAAARSDTFFIPVNTAIPEPLSAGLGMMGLLALAGVASARRRA